MIEFCAILMCLISIILTVLHKGVPETRQSLSEAPLNLLNQCNVTFETRGPYHAVIFEHDVRLSVCNVRVVGGL